MLEPINVVGYLLKSRAPGSKNKAHKYVAIIHVQGSPNPRRIYPKDMAMVPAMLRNYARAGKAVRIELAPSSPYSSEAAFVAAAKHEAQPRGTGVHTPYVVFNPFQQQKPQTLVSEPDIEPVDPKTNTPKQIIHVDAREVLEARVNNHLDEKKVATSNLARAAKLDRRSTRILDQLETAREEIVALTLSVEELDEEINDDDEPEERLIKLKAQKLQALKNRQNKIRSLQAELGKRPLGYRRAMGETLKMWWEKLKADAKNTEKWGEKGRPDWTQSPEAQRIRWMAARLRGEDIAVRPAGARPFGFGEFVRLSALKDYPEVDPTDQPMGYLLTDGWKNQKVFAGVNQNIFTASERAALLDEYVGTGRRVLFGGVWKEGQQKGWFRAFPSLLKDDEFKHDLEATVQEAILDAATHYTPDFAEHKLGEGISFPMYVRAKIKGELRREFSRKLTELYDAGKFVKEPVPGTAEDTQRMTVDQILSEFHDSGDESIREVFNANEKRYADPEEHALVRQAEDILQNKFEPEMLITFLSKLNVYNTQDVDPWKIHGKTAITGHVFPVAQLMADTPSNEAEAHLQQQQIKTAALRNGLKTDEEVAHDLRERFGGSLASWTKQVGSMWSQAVKYLTDKRLKKFTPEERAAIYEGLRVYADMLGHKKAAVFVESWRRQGSRSVREPRLKTVKPSKEIVEKIKVAHRGGNMQFHAARNRPHVSFFMRKENEALAQRLSAFMPENVTVVNGKELRSYKPGDIRDYSALPDVVEPFAVQIQNLRLKKFHDAYRRLDKLDTAKLKAKIDSPKTQRAFKLSESELRTIIETLIDRRAAKKSLLDSRPLGAMLDRVLNEIIAYEVACACL